MIGRKRRRGFGAAGDILYGSVIDTGLGTKVDCRDWPSYLLNPACWVMSHDSWNQVGAAYDAATYIAPTVVPPVAPQTQPQMTGAAPWTPDIALAQTKAAQTAANQAWAAQVAANIAATQPGAPDCTSTWTYYTNSACPADCSRFWTNLLNPSCPGLGLGWKTAGLVAIAAGVLLLVVVIRR